MGWTIEYLASARKDVRALDAEARRRIRRYLERLATLDDPRSVGAPLKGRLHDLWRYRVGPYRIVAKLEDDRLVVLVVRIGHRREVYREG
ncbi:type II toxin-antitoxin system RelE family toxin [Deferrisoma palaeochoriense]